MLFEVESAKPSASEPYKARDDKDSPKIMGSPRG